MMYGTWDMSVTIIIFCHFVPFFPFFSLLPPPPNNPGNQSLRKTPGDIIILHMCTKNYDHMMYNSWDMVRNEYVDCIKKITQAKNNYIHKVIVKLQNHSTAPKWYWAILTHLLYNKKIPEIPLLLVNGKFVSDFLWKSKSF